MVAEQNVKTANMISNKETQTRDIAASKDDYFVNKKMTHQTETSISNQVDEKKHFEDFPEQSRIDIAESNKTDFDTFEEDITGIREEINIFDEKSEENLNIGDIKLLGELLRFLRSNKYMALLMICRNINKIDVSRETVVIDIDEKSNDEIFSNETHKKILIDFFKERNLDLKQKEKRQEISDAEKLNILLGGKLVIKHS